MLKLKVAQIFPKVAQNVYKAVFIWKGTFFQIAQKSLYIWATFETKYFTQNFRKSPNLVTLLLPPPLPSFCSIPFSAAALMVSNETTTTGKERRGNLKNKKNKSRRHQSGRESARVSYWGGRERQNESKLTWEKPLQRCYYKMNAQEKKVRYWITVLGRSVKEWLLRGLESAKQTYFATSWRWLDDPWPFWRSMPNAFSRLATSSS